MTVAYSGATAGSGRATHAGEPLRPPSARPVSSADFMSRPSRLTACVLTTWLLLPYRSGL